MMLVCTRKVLCLLVVLALMATVWGCTGDGQTAPGGSEAEQGATMAQPAEGEGITALSGAEMEAQVEADEWQSDAQLYAVAAATPNLNAQGESPSWLYTYVSESAGAVMSVTVSEGGAKSEAAPQQELPEGDIDLILDNTLPEVSGMIDSSEAMERSEDVRPVLEENPGAQASAGLDSFSGGEAQWIFATTQGEDRVEERVPAVGGE